jgi:hypothetical protein
MVMFCQKRMGVILTYTLSYAIGGNAIGLRNVNVIYSKLNIPFYKCKSA